MSEDGKGGKADPLGQPLWAAIEPTLKHVQEVLASSEDELAEAFGLYETFAASSHPADRLIADWLDSLLFREVLEVKSRLKPPPQKRGRKRGVSAANRELIERAKNNLIAIGATISMSAIAREIGRLTRRDSPDQVENIRRNLCRIKGVT